MSKYIITVVVSATFLVGSAYAEKLSDLKGLERIGSASGAHSPSQVVILNNTPNHTQEQNQEMDQNAHQNSGQWQQQKHSARVGWGNGDSLENLRNSRIEKEAKNEQVLMEKLETSRMEDEKSRLRRLFKVRQYNRRRHEEMGEDDYEFGSDTDHGMETYHEVVEQPVVVASAPMIVADPCGSAGCPTPTPVVSNVVNNNVTPAPTPVVETSSYDSRRSLFSGGDKYIKGQIGLGGYKAANTVGTASWGVAVGKDINSRLSFELGLYKTSYDVNDPNAAYAYDQFGNFSQKRDLDQYNLSGVLGFKLINSNGVVGSLRGGASYVRRDSESSDIKGFQAFRSNAIDGMIGVGADIEVAQNISVTGTFDYYMNLINDIASTNADVVERVETADYYVLGVGLKLKF